MSDTAGESNTADLATKKFNMCSISIVFQSVFGDNYISHKVAHFSNAIKNNSVLLILS